MEKKKIHQKEQELVNNPEATVGNMKTIEKEFSWKALGISQKFI